MSISRFNIKYNTLIDPGNTCQGGTVTWTNPVGLVVPCSDSNSVDVEINTDVAGPYCVTFIISCEGCSSCGQIEVTKCFCVNADDCENCTECQDNVCVSRCADGKVCDEDTCVDCTDEIPCPCNQLCSQGTCRCPAGKKARPDGCCVECFDGEDLGPCRICIGGNISSVDCPSGICNPDTGECNECLNNEQCSGPNECCVGGHCDCCPGFILDPDTDQCVPAPPCTGSEDCEARFGLCYYCTENGCAPKVCPTDFVCDPDTGDCVPGCVNGVCPEGYGCLNGRCVPCSSLSCSGVGELCQFAEGCECNGLACEYINCNLDTVDLEWVSVPGTPGTVQPGTGLPALAGTTSIAALAMVYNQAPYGSGYFNHQFNLAITNGNSGNWVLENAPGQTISLGTGTSISFDLTQTGPNLVGFVVKFTESNTGRTATWGIYRTPTAPLNAPNVWNYEFQSTGIAATMQGGTPGSFQLCATNGNFTPTGVTNVTTTGTIVVSFVPTGQNCLIAYVQGCGIWNGDVIVQCGGQTLTIPAPQLSIDPANCCDPADSNCGGWSTGDPCGDLTIQNITLVALPTYGHTGSGDGEFLIVADWTTAGLSFLDLFYLNPADGCWSVANNPASSSNDVAIVTAAGQSPLGPSVSNLSVVATMGDGGCVRLGYTCDLIIGGCKKLQGEICMTECSVWDVQIVAVDATTYSAIVSLLDETVTYQWFTDSGTITNPTGSTCVWSPAGGSHQICVSAKYGNPVKCSDQVCLVVNTSVSGCTNSSACNYNPLANVDDNSCIFIGSPSYDCALGGFQPGPISTIIGDSVAIKYYIGGIEIHQNGKKNPGTYTVDVYFNGVQACSKTLVVPQCYRCSAGNCIPAPTGDNNGPFTSSDCDSACSCDIEINVTEVCNNNRSALVITATGDTGNYTVTVNKVGGSQVLGSTALTSSGSVTTPLLCSGTYRIIVTGANCDKSRDFTTSCFSCGDSTSALTNISYDCATNQLFATIVADACATGYTIRLLDSSLNVEVTQAFASAGAKTIPVGVYPGDGVYNVQLTDSNGCVTNNALSLNCNNTLPSCPLDSDIGLLYSFSGLYTSFTTSFSLTSGGDNYSITLYSTTGGSPYNCVHAIPDAIIGSHGVVGTVGLNTVNFPNAVLTPGVSTCYYAEVKKIGDDNCVTNTTVLVVPSVPPVSCSIDITNASYDVNTGNILLSWNGSGTSNDVTVQIQVSTDATCHVGDTLVINIDGNGEDGINIPFGPIPQLQGQAQCTTITLFDTNDSSCNDTYEFQVPACSCAIVIDESSVEIDPDAETASFTFTTKCTSGDIDIDISGDATGSTTISNGSEDGTVDSHDVVVALTGYPSIGGTITIEVSDDADGACIDTYVVALPQNCVDCAQIVSVFLEDSVVTEVRNSVGALIASGLLTANAAGEAAFKAAVENGVQTDGGNFCLGSTPVDLQFPRSSGFKVNQDSTTYSTLNYVQVTDAAFVGDRKSYFGDCGCVTGDIYDYEYVIPISADASQVTINFADNNPGIGYTQQYVSGITQTPSPSELSQIEADLLTLLEAANCGYTVGSVTATYDTGLDELTVTVLGTNAGMGIAFTSETTPVYVEATQS